MNKAVYEKFISFIKDEDGQALVEYALLLFVFTMISYCGISLYIHAWKNRFNNLQSTRAGIQGMLP